MDKLKSYCSTPGARAQLAAADGIGVTLAAISHWCNGIRRVPAEKCRAIEAATGGQVTRHDLRPDVFGPAPTEQAA